MAELGKREHCYDVVQVTWPKYRDRGWLLCRARSCGDERLVVPGYSVGEDIQLLHCIVYKVNSRARIRYNGSMGIATCAMSNERVDSLY